MTLPLVNVDDYERAARDCLDLAIYDYMAVDGEGGRGLCSICCAANSIPPSP